MPEWKTDGTAKYAKYANPETGGGNIWFVRVFRVFRGYQHFLGGDLGAASGLARRFVFEHQAFRFPFAAELLPDAMNLRDDRIMHAIGFKAFCRNRREPRRFFPRHKAASSSAERTSFAGGAWSDITFSICSQSRWIEWPALRASISLIR